jgi:hypothetical protein
MVPRLMSDPTGDLSKLQPPELLGSANRWHDESLAPDVDRGLLVALVQKKLSDESARAVYRLIHSFKSWHTAHQEALVAEFHGDEPD